ncbi:MAG: hypothetical protein EA378_06465 [Phycisphaerales bacterium]|nr:MAG: hypothetical protein EA378_06465 [Phycisphaerales bacterium]
MMGIRTAATVFGIAAITGVASAQQGSVGGVANFDWTTGAAADGVIVALDVQLSVPDIISIDSIDFDLRHVYLSDLHIALVSPGGDVFTLALGQGTVSLPAADPYLVEFGPFNGGFNGVDVGNVGGTELAAYSFVETGGGIWNQGGATEGGVRTPGAYDAISFPTGAFAAGDWRLVVLDVFPQFDGGGLGAYTINYTIPAPGAMALLGLGGLVATRRRR